ncbi:MAG: helix-turn-helix domain-containing protein [Atopobiaceae bacterium]|jgi:transcriptional regulator with XRE-family HTH domain
MSVIGENIHALRLLNGGITQQELADIVGVTRETVNKWETGAIGNVRSSNVETLREHFGLSVDDLRSESNGLAAKAGHEAADDAGASCLVPVRSLQDLDGSSVPHDGPMRIEIPSGVAHRHPRSFAVVVEDSTMDAVLPRGFHAVVDPDARPRQSSIVVSSSEGRPPSIRRFVEGKTKVVLSVDSVATREDDFVLDVGDVHVIGTVVWCQPAEEFGSAQA